MLQYTAIIIYWVHYWVIIYKLYIILFLYLEILHLVKIKFNKLFFI